MHFFGHMMVLRVHTACFNLKQNGKRLQLLSFYDQSYAYSWLDIIFWLI